jgi:hypothetical protein
MLVYELNGSNSRRTQSKPNLFSCNFQESGINNFQIKFLYNFVILEFFYSEYMEHKQFDR